MTEKQRAPSTVTDEYWIFAETPDSEISDPDVCGKWQLFISRDHIDEAWATVSAMVASGELGPEAKVSTARPNPNNPSAPDKHVVIVYAADWRNVGDLRRILRNLREAGLTRGWVHFKRDKETRAGAYINRGSRGVSVWNAGPDSDEISTKWATGERLVVTDENLNEVIAQIETYGDSH
jgi:hypothetical protein